MRILAFVLLLGSAAAAGAQDFRGLSWGAQREAVVEREGEPLATQGDCLLYRDRVAEREARVLFCLHEEAGLYRGGYVFEQRYPLQPQRHVDDYRQLHERLAARYGQPSREEVDWHDPRLQLHQSNWGHRIAAGALSLRSEWEAPNGQILMVLERGDDRVRHYLRYESAERLALQRQREREHL